MDLIVLFQLTFTLIYRTFLKKKFSFKKKTHQKITNIKCCESLWEGSPKLGEIFWCLPLFYLFILFDNTEAILLYFQMFRRCILILKMNGIFSEVRPVIS